LTNGSTVREDKHLLKQSTPFFFALKELGLPPRDHFHDSKGFKGITSRTGFDVEPGAEFTETSNILEQTQ